jgi:hypothetical protein
MRRKKGDASMPVEGETAKDYEHKAGLQTKADMVDVNSNGRPNSSDSHLSSDTDPNEEGQGQAIEEQVNDQVQAGNQKTEHINVNDNQNMTEQVEISACFDLALAKLNKVRTFVIQQKSQIIKELARDLKATGKIRPDSICIEIIERLRGRVSERLIRKCLDSEYKDQRQAENAKKQQHKVAAKSAAKQEIITDTSGHSTQRQVSELHESTDAVTDNSKPRQQLGATQDSKSVTINKTQEVGSGNDGGIDADILPTVTIDVVECGQYKIKDSEEESTITPSFNDELASPIEQNEDLTDANKKVLVSIISMPFEALRKDMEAVFRITKGIGKIFLKVSFDLERDMAEIEFCGITQHKDVTMTSKGKGRILKGA